MIAIAAMILGWALYLGLSNIADAIRDDGSPRDEEEQP